MNRLLDDAGLGLGKHSDIVKDRIPEADIDSIISLAAVAFSALHKHEPTPEETGAVLARLKISPGVVAVSAQLAA